MATAAARQVLRRELLELFPALSYFYGLGFLEMLRMPRWALRAYANALDRLQAEEELASVRATAYPHLKRTGQRSYMGQLRRRMQRGIGSTSRRLPKGQYGAMLSNIGIGLHKKLDEKRDETSG